ncbi:MAG: MFS transporter [Planctomycetota bacterium]
MNDQPATQGRGAIRWIVLGLMSLVIFSNYYLYDCFSTLKGTFQTELVADSEAWGWVRNSYSFPNVWVFMVLLGGILVDRFGIRKTGIVSTAMCALGGIVTAYAVTDTFRNGGLGHGLVDNGLVNWLLPEFSSGVKLMMLGRLLFGLGAETQIVMLNKVLAKWFMGKELALAFGLNLGLARLGTALGMQVSPRIAEQYDFQSALWVGALVMISGLVLFLVYSVMDYQEDKRRGAASGAAKLADEEKFRLSDIQTLLVNKTFILITLLCATFYAVVFPFQDFLADLLTHKYGYEKVDAGDLTSMIPYAAAICTIAFGALVDRKGLRATLMLGGSSILLISLLCFGLTNITPLVLIPLAGIAFSLVPAAMWPAVALIVDEKKLGTAYGLMAWVQNLLCWVMPPLAGWTLDKSNPGVKPENIEAGTGVYNYTSVILMFAALAAVAVFIAVSLRLSERGKSYSGLELPSAEAAKYNKDKREAAK